MHLVDHRYRPRRLRRHACFLPNWIHWDWFYMLIHDQTQLPNFLTILNGTLLPIRILGTLSLMPFFCHIHTETADNFLPHPLKKFITCSTSIVYAIITWSIFDHVGALYTYSIQHNVVRLLGLPILEIDTWYLMGIRFFHISLLHIYNIDSAAYKSYLKSKRVISYFINTELFSLQIEHQMFSYGVK